MSWEESCRKILTLEGQKLSLEFTEDKTEQIIRYGALLVEWNEKMNLTGITDPEGVAVKHMLDSLVGAALIPQGAKVIDVGTGAGFPGLVLKIFRPDIELTLLDSLRKRLTFLETVIGELNLAKVVTIHGRAEEWGHKKECREQFDVAVARAVASMPLLSEYCLPFVKVGGKFLAWKGPKGKDEVLEGKKAFELLGGGACRVHEFVFPGADENRLIIELKKKKPIEKKYPRKPGSAPL